MERSQRAITQADLVLWVVDGSTPPSEEDRAIQETLNRDRVSPGDQQDGSGGGRTYRLGKRLLPAIGPSNLRPTPEPG